MRAAARKSLLGIYERLLRACGPQHWWPARTSTEIVVGAILTQNTVWSNVERAIDNLRRAKVLTWRALRDLPERELAELIRPSGTFRVKARRLAAFVRHLWEHHEGSLRSLLDGELETARRGLLSIHGIGPETADAILLYAGNRATFVVDAYTRRVLRRHHLCDEKADYETIRRLFHAALPADVQRFNEYHALLVAVGKKHCRKSAQCEGCPLVGMPHDRTL
jgi:endonuclease-3 related protein